MDESKANDTASGQAPGQTGMAHTAVMIRAALPYLSPELNRPLSLLAKGMDFLASAKGFRLSDALTAFSFRDGDNPITDMNGLLGELKKVALPSELNILNMLSALLNVRKFYDMYQSMAPLLAGLNGMDGFGTDSASSAASSPFSSGLFSDPTSLLRFTELFQMFSGGGMNGAGMNLFGMNGAGMDSSETDGSGMNGSGMNDVSRNNSGAAPSGTDSPEHADFSSGSGHDSSAADFTDSTPSQNSNAPPDSSMFDLLSALLPPEQQSTFQLLKQFMSPGMNSPSDSQNADTESSSNNAGSAGAGYASDGNAASEAHPHYTPDTLPFPIPSDLEACQVPSYPEVGRPSVIYRGGLIDPTANQILLTDADLPDDTASCDVRSQNIA